MKKIYMDYAATTRTDLRVIKVMMPYFNERSRNTVSIYSSGQATKSVVEESRRSIAGFIGCSQDELIFTSSATESSNLALKGVAFANMKKGKHIIISQIEHPCVMESSRWLEKEGFEVTRIGVDGYGTVDPDDIENSIRKDTILVSIMHANNEIGTVEPIKEIGRICDEKGVYLNRQEDSFQWEMNWRTKTI